FFEPAAPEIVIQLGLRALIRFGSAVRLGGAIQRAPQIATNVPLDVVGDEQIQLAVAVVIQPRRAGSETGVVNPRRLSHIAKLAAPFVLKEAVATESGNVY